MTKLFPPLCLTALLLTAIPLCAQSVALKAALPSPDTLVPDSSSDYLIPLLILRPLRASYMASPEWRDSYCETLGINESFVGNDAEAITDFDAGRSLEPQKPVADAKATLIGYAAVDARQAILTLAIHCQAVFVHEADYAPRDRAFTLSLLRGLYAEGYRYFTAETLNSIDFHLQKRGYPVVSTGYLTREPVFGDLVRTALKIGYKVVPYEYRSILYPDPVVSQNLRNKGEAQNLYDGIFKQYPNAKVLVEAGYGQTTRIHADGMNRMDDDILGGPPPKPSSDSIIPMAVWFHKLTGIKPLRVDQAAMMEHSALEYEDPVYKAAIADNLLQETPVALKNKSGHFFVDPKQRSDYDISVFHPRTLYQFGRPTWLSEDGERQAYVLPGDLGIPANTPALVQAFYASEDAQVAVPVDQIEIKPGLNPLPALMLPSGKFHLRVVDGAGKILRDWQVDRTGATP